MKPFGNLFGGKSDGSGKGTFYASAAGLKLHAKPHSSSSAVGELSLHQKVYRSKVENGFAYVKVAATGQSGWVENAKLIWRLPSDKGTAAVSAAEPVADPASLQPSTAEQAPVPEIAPATSEEPNERQGADPSLFNPF